jgi:hypothetical protein
MLLLACAYMVVRFFKNRKISKQVNSQTLWKNTSYIFSRAYAR